MHRVIVMMMLRRAAFWAPTGASARAVSVTIPRCGKILYRRPDDDETVKLMPHGNSQLMSTSGLVGRSNEPAVGREHILPHPVVDMAEVFIAWVLTENCSDSVLSFPLVSCLAGQEVLVERRRQCEDDNHRRQQRC